MQKFFFQKMPVVKKKLGRNVANFVPLSPSMKLRNLIFFGRGFKLRSMRIGNYGD